MYLFFIIQKQFWDEFITVQWEFQGTEERGERLWSRRLGRSDRQVVATKGQMLGGSWRGFHGFQLEHGAFLGYTLG